MQQNLQRFKGFIKYLPGHFSGRPNTEKLELKKDEEKRRNIRDLSTKIHCTHQEKVKKTSLCTEDTHTCKITDISYIKKINDSYV